MVRTALLTLWLLALSAPAALACPRPGRRRGHLGRGRRQGRHQRRLHPDRRLPAADPAATLLQSARSRSARTAASPRPRRAPRARRPPRRLVIHYERRGSAALVTIDRPERHNAIDGADRRRAAGRPSSASAPTTTPHVLVLTGAGDAGVLRRRRPEGDRDARRRRARRPARLHPPGLAQADDRRDQRPLPRRRARARALVRPAGRDRRPRTFGCAERRWGVPLIDGGTQRLPRDRRHGPRARPDPHRPHDRRRTRRSRSACVTEVGRRRATSSARSRSPSEIAALPAGHDAQRPPRRCSRARACRSHDGLALEARAGPRALRPRDGARRFAGGARRCRRDAQLLAADRVSD